MYDIVIFGAGPVGPSAAITEIGDPDLVDIGKKQALRLGAEIKEETVQNVTSIEGKLSVVTDQGIYEVKHVLLATGALTDPAETIGTATKPGTVPRIKTVVDVDTAGRTSISGVWAAAPQQALVYMLSLQQAMEQKQPLTSSAN
ncbi:hypothetical protein GCM10010918_32260 [Paenibacillus radicis (ex Gao et al. 2016)]|uniref:FAD/NAD(P)-binding domain-containing protein n=1 Tax=Paenibacillus radicis (ex Gao et al. 2016) TaxID=1737354 RepID=A0A917HBQ1_9BACL|nr:hypothetical protein GCM10010918_32260 [Paenibacillus radicis (ex Gao et al. 2016)]